MTHVTGSFATALSEHLQVAEASRALAPQVDALAARLAEVLRAGKKLLWCGNGGSAADCQHLAAEFVIRFERERAGLAAIALTTDTSILTACANDYGYARVFARQVEALGQAGDALIAISTSGTSPSVIAAVEAAKARGLLTVGLTGGIGEKAGGNLRELCDVCVVVPSARTARIQEIHLLIGHTLCGLVDELL